MVAHRGNLNYQDCRRTLTAGFEPSEIDLLQVNSMNTGGTVLVGTTDSGGSIPEEEIANTSGNSLPMNTMNSGGSVAAETIPRTSGSSGGYLAEESSLIRIDSAGTKERVRFRVKITSAGILASEFWKVLNFDWMGGLEVSDRAQRKAAEFLAKYLTGKMCHMLSHACSSLYHLEFERHGAADASRVGDRFLSLDQRLLHGYVKEFVVEGIRTGIQTSFYTCDYTTKPSLTCGPVLKHLTHGMEQLEHTMRAEAEQEEAKRLQLSYPLPPLQEGRGLTAEQREARRRLCRLWTSANHAVMHGFCLMSLQLLTGREVIRTHIFWRIMLKRVLWGIFEEMRKNVEKITDAFEVQSVAAVGDLELGGSGSDGADTRATSFYEDYLHRGSAEPLASMNLYVYAMHVSAVPIHEAGKFDHGEFEFTSHYVKARSHVQILHVAARIPYLHGISMPTKQKDPEMWAAVHVALLRKHSCESEKFCGKAQAVRHIRRCSVAQSLKGRPRVVAPGSDFRAVCDRSGVLAEWKATEAHMQCLADRADVTC